MQSDHQDIDEWAPALDLSKLESFYPVRSFLRRKGRRFNEASAELLRACRYLRSDQIQGSTQVFATFVWLLNAKDSLSKAAKHGSPADQKRVKEAVNSVQDFVESRRALLVHEIDFGTSVLRTQIDSLVLGMERNTQNLKRTRPFIFGRP